jgi:hypothetical protein
VVLKIGLDAKRVPNVDPATVRVFCLGATSGEWQLVVLRKKSVHREFIVANSPEMHSCPHKSIRREVVYFTNADVTVRRPYGAILVIYNYEITAMSDRKKHNQYECSKQLQSVTPA